MRAHGTRVSILPAPMGAHRETASASSGSREIPLHTAEDFPLKADIDDPAVRLPRAFAPRAGDSERARTLVERPRYRAEPARTPVERPESRSWPARRPVARPELASLLARTPLTACDKRPGALGAVVWSCKRRPERPGALVGSWKRRPRRLEAPVGSCQNARRRRESAEAGRTQAPSEKGSRWRRSDEGSSSIRMDGTVGESHCSRRIRRNP